MLVTGTVQLARLTPVAPTTARIEALGRIEQDSPANGLTRLASPDDSLQLTWDRRKVSVSCDGNRLAIVLGRMRFGGAEAGPDPARAWLDRARDGLEAAFRSIGGAFALVHIDLESRSSVLAVDRFAVNSLCFALQGGKLVFSDRADALPGTFALDPQSIYDYLYFHMIPAPATIFRGVRRVEAGHRVVVTASDARSERYWQPRFTETRGAPLAELKSEFRSLVRNAVAREGSQESIGAFLSGGTDSSTVAGMLTEVTGRPARTYSIGFDQAGYDEMEYARIAAKRFGTDHHEYYVTPEDLIESMPKLAAYFDQPFGNSSAAPAYCCARVAAGDGVRTLLAGDGGDELFGGNARYAKQRIFGVYDHIPGVARHLLLEPILLGSSMPAKIPGIRKAASYVAQARVPMPERMETYNLLEYIGAEEVLEQRFLSGIDPGGPRERQRTVYGATRAASLVDRMLEYDWKFTLADNDLRKVVDATTLAGVGVAFPFLDDELVDFSLRLDSSHKVRGLKLRWLFKEALRGFLPDEILTKKKHGFGLPFGPWAASHPGLQKLTNDALESFSARRIVRRDFLERLPQLLKLQPGFYGEMIWILAMLELWLQSRGIDPVQSQ